MKNKAFLEFLLSKESPPAAIKHGAKLDISLSFRSSSIITKFVFFQIIGALFSMSVCPQFGLGLVDGHGITHVFRMIGDWACAAFCGSFFLSVGLAVALIGMKGEELWWVWRRFKYTLIILPALLWSGLMLTNITLNLPSETISYHLIWLVSAILAQYLFLQMRSSLYLLRISRVAS
jgi:hypothetical protein